MAREILTLDAAEFPKSRGVGRQRQPSEFDDVVAESYTNGVTKWIPFEGEDDLRYVDKELTRAAQHCENAQGERGVGLQRRVESLNGMSYRVILAGEKRPRGQREEVSEGPDAAEGETVEARPRSKRQRNAE